MSQDCEGHARRWTPDGIRATAKDRWTARCGDVMDSPFYTGFADIQDVFRMTLSQEDLLHPARGGSVVVCTLVIAATTRSTFVLPSRQITSDESWPREGSLSPRSEDSR